MYKPLEPPDSLRTQAARGWLELGNPTEASAELAADFKLQSQNIWMASPPAADLCYAEDWAVALKLAQAVIRRCPERPEGWILRSCALHYLQRTRQAYGRLKPRLKTFPDSAQMLYCMACFSCCLGRLGEARRWLRQVFALSGWEARTFQRLALVDLDLEPLWESD